MMGEGVPAERRWCGAPTWPPPPERTTALFLQPEGGLGAAPPAAGAEASSYVYDPADPVPTLWTPEFRTMVSDRNRLSHREDILRFRTEPLPSAMTVVGCPVVRLHCKSATPDTDFFARLVDEHPAAVDGSAGRALEVSYAMLRASSVPGFAAGTPVELVIELGPTACCFAAGHRIRLEVTSSCWPNHDRNHNTGRNDLFDAELVVTTNSVLHSAGHASCLELPTIDF